MSSACKILSIDLETYSSVDLVKSGVYRYAEAPDFEILLLAYAYDDKPVIVVDLINEMIPYHVQAALTDPNVIKVAYNANFERVCLARWLGEEMPPEQWRCTMIHAATLGLPRSLGDVGRALGIPEDRQKMKEGKALVSYFCKPCKPTKSNGGRTRNMPYHDRDKWRTFMEYNRRDVEVERDIRKILDAYPVPEEEWAAWWLDQRINDRGILADMALVEAAIDISKEHSADLTDEASRLTGLENVNSVSQLKGWLGVDGSLDKKAVAALRSGDLPDDMDRVLAIRQELGKSSVSKYSAIQRSVCKDGRVHGAFRFYGANRTGRWAGQIVQLQNLPRNYIENLAAVRDIVKDLDRDALQCLYGNVPVVLSELIRTAFVAPEGHTLVVADFNAIEARVIAWLADEVWRQRVFANKGDIYCASASQMFGVPVEKNGVNGHLRQKGKIAELALGYGGGPGALTAMGALEMGLSEEELPGLVTAWREANPNIVALWWLIDKAAKETIQLHLTDWRHDLPHGLSMRMSRKMLHVRLPSGRELRYWKPYLALDEYGRENIVYGGMDAGRWSEVRTYGPKLVENIVQAISRDCLRDAMLSVSYLYPIIMHVHDEIVVEVPKEQEGEALHNMLQLMKSPVPWAPGLSLAGAGYACPFYQKD